MVAGLALAACGGNPASQPNAVSSLGPTASTTPDPSPTSDGATTTKPPTSTKTTSTQSSSWPSPEDCVSYNANNVQVDYSNGTYAVTAGGVLVMRFIAQQDDMVAEQAKALAQRYTKHCYIGRSNTRTEFRGSYIFDYWRNTSGLNRRSPARTTSARTTTPATASWSSPSTATSASSATMTARTTPSTTSSRRRLDLSSSGFASATV